MFVRFDTTNATKPSQNNVCPALCEILCEISLHSREPALRNLPPISGCLPNVALVLVFVLITLYACFLSYFLFILSIFTPLSSVLPFLLLFLNSYLFKLFLQESTFEIHLSVWPSFSCLISSFAAPIRGHTNFQRQSALWIQKYPMCSSNMLIFSSFSVQEVATECFQRQTVLQKFSPLNISRTPVWICAYLKC